MDSIRILTEQYNKAEADMNALKSLVHFTRKERNMLRYAWKMSCKYPDTTLILYFNPHNPKQGNSLSYYRYHNYKNSKTPREFEETRGRFEDFVYDLEHKYVELNLTCVPFECRACISEMLCRLEHDKRKYIAAVSMKQNVKAMRQKILHELFPYE